MRPVETQAVPTRTAKKVMDGDAQRAGLDVGQRVLNRGDSLPDHAAWGLAGKGVKL